MNEIFELAPTRNDVLRLAIGQPEGRRSGVWRIWFGDADIYVAYRSMGHVRKASIHFPRPPEHPQALRYIGYTSDYAKQVDLPTSVRDRASLIWPGAHIGQDYFIEFRIRIPECELRRFAGDDISHVLWLPTPSPKTTSELFLISGPPHHSGLAPQKEGSSM